ncbi:MAG: hypothetical protein JSW18_01430, partial [Candidatus Omnitrophota bacterium]
FQQFALASARFLSLKRQQDARRRFKMLKPEQTHKKKPEIEQKISKLGENNSSSVTKSSSAGEDFGVSAINQVFEEEFTRFLSIQPHELIKNTPELLKATFDKTISDLESIKRTTPEAAPEVSKPLKRASDSQWVLNRSLEAADTSNRLNDIIPTKHAELDISGTIIVNDEEIPKEQKTGIVELLKKSSPHHDELIRRLGMNVVLASEYNPQQDRTTHMIAISNAKIEGLEDAKYLNIQSEYDKEAFLPITPSIIFAKGLLLYDITQQSPDVKGMLSGLYKVLTRGGSLQDKLLQQFIDASVFMLSLPKPEPVDKEYFDELQRLALQTLIAA